ncbi:hypothetical protein DINM_002104 [Dirofilaria immitis]|nr:hypothetical protein [Dirofilaria immitis]
MAEGHLLLSNLCWIVVSTYVRQNERVKMRPKMAHGINVHPRRSAVDCCRIHELLKRSSPKSPSFAFLLHLECSMKLLKLFYKLWFRALAAIARAIVAQALLVVAIVVSS